MNIDEIIIQMNRTAAPARSESIESVAARIEVMHSLLARAKELGRSSEMRAQILHNTLVPQMRVRMRNLFRAEGIQL